MTRLRRFLAAIVDRVLYGDRRNIESYRLTVALLADLKPLGGVPSRQLPAEEKDAFLAIWWLWLDWYGRYFAGMDRLDDFLPVGEIAVKIGSRGTLPPPIRYDLCRYHWILGGSL